MKVTLTQKDWMLISAYLDERLSNAEIGKVESRLKTDLQFKQAFTEIQYARRILRSLPMKRAPRNFTLSPQRIKMPVRRGWFQPALSFVSATAALVLIVVFAGSTLLPMLGVTKSAAPMMALAPEAAMDTTQKLLGESTEAPMIILWNPAQGAGGGNGNEALGSYTSGPGIGGGGVAHTEAPVIPPAPMAAESPTAKTLTQTQSDPSTLILGLPEPGTGGEIINRDFSKSEPSKPALPASTFWIISLAALSLVSGVLALILRRR